MTDESKATKVKILIIDDEQTIAKMFADRLRVKIYNVETMILSDPLQAKETIDSYKPDLVLLDFNMPQLSGLDCLKTLRTQFSKIDLPIIMLTGEESSTYIVGCLEAGANDYIVKGSPFSVVLSRVASQLSLSEIMKERVRLKELNAIMALVVSYNHEINNPLFIVLGNLSSVKSSIDPKRYEAMQVSLMKISEVVKSLTHIGDNFQVEYDKYSEGTKMIKIK